MMKSISLHTAFIFLSLVFLILLPLVSCDSTPDAAQANPVPTDTPGSVENTVTLSYTLPFLPIIFTLDSSGHISVGLGLKITTLIGTFEVSASSAITVKPVPDSSLLLVIRHHEGTRLVDSVYRIDVGRGAGHADIKGHFTEVNIGWNGKSNSIFIDASNGDIASIVIQGTATTPTTTVLPSTPTRPPTLASTKETLLVDFLKNTTCNTTSTGVKTAHRYRGKTRLTIHGTGYAKGKQLSDAFYIYTDEHLHAIQPLHDDGIGAILFINNQPADNFIQGAIPAYNAQSDHSYTFSINAPAGQLTFSVGDCKADNNKGTYSITISSP